MRFIVDESTGRKLTSLIKQAGYDSIFSRDALPKADDVQILDFAEKNNWILITDDKDFGELIFRLNRPSSGVIFLRLAKDPVKRFERIKDILDNAEHKFTVVKEGQIRVRDLK